MITLSGGTASFTTATLPPGSHLVQAVYVGDNSFTGSFSAPLSEVIGNPAPLLTGMSTTSVLEGTGSFTLTLTGSGFLSTSTVQWNGAPMAITALSATQIQVTVPAPFLAEEGTAGVIVSNPGPGGGSSLPQIFTIADAPLTAAGRNISVTGKKNFSGLVATFTDGNLNATQGEFTAIITWDDGSAHFGTITRTGAGSFTVSGSHTFHAFNNVHVVTVAIYDEGGSQATVTDNVIDPRVAGTRRKAVLQHPHGGAGGVKHLLPAGPVPKRAAAVHAPLKVAGRHK